MAKGGYIIKIKPMAIGMLVVLSGDVFNDSQKTAIPGKKYPDNTPIAMARKIHIVRYRSKNFNLGFDGIILNFRIVHYFLATTVML